MSPDGWERRNNLDPNDASGDNGSDGDPDGDGVPNNDEQERGTNPSCEPVRPKWSMKSNNFRFDVEKIFLAGFSSKAFMNLKLVSLVVVTEAPAACNGQDSDGDGVDDGSDSAPTDPCDTWDDENISSSEDDDYRVDPRETSSHGGGGSGGDGLGTSGSGDIFGFPLRDTDEGIPVTPELPEDKESDEKPKCCGGVPLPLDTDKYCCGDEMEGTWVDSADNCCKGVEGDFLVKEKEQECCEVDEKECCCDEKSDSGIVIISDGISDMVINDKFDEDKEREDEPTDSNSNGDECPEESKVEMHALKIIVPSEQEEIDKGEGAVIEFRLEYSIVSLYDLSERRVDGKLRLEIIDSANGEKADADDWVIKLFDPKDESIDQEVGKEITLPHEIEIETEEDFAGSCARESALSGRITLKVWLKEKTEEDASGSSKSAPIKPLSIKFTADPSSGSPSITSFAHLLPVDMRVDANRDGKIDFGTEDDFTTEDKPFRFWINTDEDDDDDDYDRDADGTKAQNNTGGDSEDDEIETKRDLEDFTRLHLSLAGLVEYLESGDWEIGLKFTDVKLGEPTIKIYQAADKDEGSLSYIEDEEIAGQQIEGDFGEAIVTVSAEDEWEALPASLFEDIEEDNPYLYLIFEGVKEGEGKLNIVLRPKEGEESLVPLVDIKLQNVRKMYERSRAIPSDIPYPHDYYLPKYGDVPNLPMYSVKNDKAHKYEPDPDEEEHYIIFVHGWNMKESGATAYADTTFKRLWHQNYKGRFAAFYWPTYVGITTYNDSDYIAYKSGEALKQYVNSLSNKYSKNLVAHSMGNIVCGSAFEQGLSIENYAMLNAAVPAMCYDDDKSLYYFHAPPKTPDDDGSTKKLGYENIFSSSKAKIINFYLPKDSALGLWVYNNNKKPSTVINSERQRIKYFYRTNNPSGKKLGFYLSDECLAGVCPFRFVTKKDEARAFVVKSHTYTVGTMAVNKIVEENINLEDFFGKDQEEHSAEWKFIIQKTSKFYEELLSQFK